MGGTTAAREVPARAEMTDEEFASQYRDGLGHLVGMFRAKGIGNEESRDLAHETVLRTLLHLKRHGRTREDIGPLSRTIARNLLVERLRKAGPPVMSLSEEMDAPDDALDPSELALQAERQEAVRTAMQALTPRHRRVIELWMQGRRPAEIARELGIKRNAADAILHRARRTLASRLGPRSLWAGVVLAWLRLKTNAKHTGQQLASWSPDSAILAPTGIAVATVGLVAAIQLSGPPSTPRPDVTPSHEIAREAPTDGIADLIDDAGSVVERPATIGAPNEGAGSAQDIGVGIGGTKRADDDSVRAGVLVVDDGKGRDGDFISDLIHGLTTQKVAP